MRAPFLLPVVLALALLTGCTGGSSDQAATGSAAESADGGGGLAPVAAPVADKAVQAPLQGRSLVRTAELRVRVDDVAAAAERAADVALGSGGVLAGEQRSDGQATLQLKVPPARLDDALERLAALGEELDRTVGSEDVTEQVVDLDSRLATQRASVARVRALLEEAQSLGDVVKVEGELAKREAELESLDARARALGARVDLAAVVLHLEGEGGVAAASGPAGFGSGLAAGWSALRTTLLVAATALGALLPFTPLLLLAGAATVWRRRRLAAAA